MLGELREKLQSQVDETVGRIQSALFGANNERLDFVMDSFYKLAPPQRNAVLAGVVGGIALFVVGAFGLYFSRVNALEAELNTGLKALNELQKWKLDYEKENAKFESLVGLIEKRTKTFRVKPFLDRTAKSLNVSLGPQFNDKKIPLGADNPLGSQVQELQAEVEFPKISIPKLLKYLIELEKSKHFLRVRDLDIRGRHGTKLYFDARAKIRGYAVGG